MRWSHPLPDQLPGEHTSDLAAVFSESTKRNTHCFGICLITHTYNTLHIIIQLKLGRSMVVGHVLMVHTCSFKFTNHIDMIAHTLAFFTSWGDIIGVCRTPVWSIHPFYGNGKSFCNFVWITKCHDCEMEHHRKDVTKMMSHRNHVCRYYYSLNNHLILIGVCIDTYVIYQGFWKIDRLVIRIAKFEHRYLEIHISNLVSWDTYVESCISIKSCISNLISHISRYVSQGISQILYLEIHISRYVSQILYLKSCISRYVSWDTYLKVYLKSWISYLKICISRHISNLKSHILRYISQGVSQILYLKSCILRYVYAFLASVWQRKSSFH